MSQQQSPDTISNIFKTVTDVLILRNPIGTSIGTLLGVALYETSRLFDLTIKRVLAIDPSKISVFYCVVLGILLPNFPSLFRRHHFDPAIEDGLAFIRKAKRDGQLSDSQIRMMYLALFRRVLEHVQLEEATEESVNKLNDALP